MPDQSIDRSIQQLRSARVAMQKKHHAMKLCPLIGTTLMQKWCSVSEGDLIYLRHGWQ